MLNFYDTEAVKAFTLKTLVENRELAESLEFERKSSTDWFNRFKEAEAKAAGADKAAAILDSVSEEIFKTLESADLPAEVNNVIAFLGHCLNDAKAVLKGGSPNE